MDHTLGFPVKTDTPFWPRWIWDLYTVVITKRRQYTQSLAPSAVSANTTSEQTFTVKGLTINDMVIINKPTHQAGLAAVAARVSAIDTLAITYMNTTTGSITPTTEIYKIMAFGE